MAGIAVLSSGADLGLVAPDAVATPAILPASAPRYVSPVSVPMMPAPVIARPPLDQHRGEGGTAFGSKPDIYMSEAPTTGQGIVEGPRNYTPLETVPIDYGPPPVLKFDPDMPPTRQPGTKPRPGDEQVMPVPRGQTPTKPGVTPTQTQVPIPGPVSGKVLGFDLATVPMWAWLVAVAVVGYRVFK